MNLDASALGPDSCDLCHRSATGPDSLCDRHRDRVAQNPGMVVRWDWKDQPVTDEGYGPLGDALRKLGVHLTPLPSAEGSDEYAFVVTIGPCEKRNLHALDAASLGIDIKEYQATVTTNDGD